MIKICPECFTTNISTNICNNCGFILSKRINSNENDIFFYDCLELINIGELNTSELTIQKNQQLLTSKQFELITDKIAEIRNLHIKAEAFYQTASEEFNNHKYSEANQNIKNAIELNGLDTYHALHEVIQSALNRQHELEIDNNRFYEALKQIETGDYLPGIQTIKDLINKYPENEQYKNSLPIAIKKYIPHKINHIETLITEKKYDEAETEIDEIKTYISDHTDVNKIYEWGQLIKREKERQIRRGQLVKTISIIAIFILISFSIICTLIYFNDKEAWENTSKIGTITAYKNFIKDNKENWFIKDAIAELKKLELQDSIAWGEILRSADKSGINDYINTFGKNGGSHLAEAYNKLDSLDWDEIIKTNNLNLVRSYIENYPLGKHIQEANLLLSTGVDDSEKNSLYQIIEKYHISLSNKDLETAISIHEETTKSYDIKEMISKDDLRNYINDSIFSQNTQFNIDRSTFNATKNPNGSYNLSFWADVNKNFYREEYNQQSGIVTPIQIQNSIKSKIQITLNANMKIEHYNSFDSNNY